MDIRELKTKTLAELHEILAKLRGELREARFKVFENQLADVRLLRNTRRTIARVLTVINQKNQENS